MRLELRDGLPEERGIGHDLFSQDGYLAAR